MYAKIYIVCLVLISVNFSNASKKEQVRLKLKNGEIEGKIVKTVDEGKLYNSFQGIPYAKPPIGDLRFAAPQPAHKWSGILDVTRPADTCIEIHKPEGNEDCLYLNVYTPSLKKSLPVIVWIHGGGFVFVYGNYSLSGVDFFMNEDVIFVTVNYRLGVFGFLSTEDETIPGNFGLKDQVMAINWVYDNIQKFGGNPDKITVMGQSAGATATSYMGQITALEGKLHGIIQQSGSSLCPFSLSRYARTGAYVLSTKLGTQSTDSSVILESLRKIDPEALRNASFTTQVDILYGTNSFYGFLYGPVLEPKTLKGALLTEMSYSELQKGRFNPIPRMMGINSLEGIFLIEELNSNTKYYSNYDEIVRRYIPIDMNTRDEHVGELIKKRYTNGASFISNSTYIVHYGTDDQFIRPMLKDAALVSKYSTTYFYEFSYEGKLGKEIRPIGGVDHGEELPYLFYNKDQGSVNVKDLSVRRKLVRLWSNFAKHGNPTPNKEELLDNQIWLPINPQGNNVNYMDIGEHLVPSLNPYQHTVKFWDHLYNTYGNPPFDTY